MEDDSILPVLLEERPPVVSFHFGIPSASTMRSLRDAGIFVLITATSLMEGQQIEAADADGIVAQGIISQFWHFTLNPTSGEAKHCKLRRPVNCGYPTDSIA